MRTRTLILAGFSALTLAGVGAAFAAQTTGRLTRLNVEETELSAEQARNVVQLARLLSVLEQLRRDPPPALLVSPNDAKDAVRAAILVRAMTPELQLQASGYAREASEIMRRRRLAAVESEALFLSDSLRANQSPEPNDPALNRSADGPAPPATPPRTLLVPVQGPVLKSFGQPLSIGGKSNGLTLGSAPGAQVMSPDAASVQYVGPVKGWGQIVILRLAGGYHVVLAGVGRTSVAVGQSVAAGDVVGWMPDGRQSPSELYLEVRNQGAPVDPGRWMTIKAG